MASNMKTSKTKKVINLKPIISKGKKGPPTGTTNNPKGRGKGVQNKITVEIKEAFKLLLERNIPNLEMWLNQVATEDQARALDIVVKLLEYYTPKLARVEGQGDNQLSITIRRLVAAPPTTTIDSS